MFNPRSSHCCGVFVLGFLSIELAILLGGHLLLSHGQRSIIIHTYILLGRLKVLNTFLNVWCAGIVIMFKLYHKLLKVYVIYLLNFGTFHFYQYEIRTLHRIQIIFLISSLMSPEIELRTARTKFLRVGILFSEIFDMRKRIIILPNLLTTSVHMNGAVQRIFSVFSSVRVFAEYNDFEQPYSYLQEQYKNV